MKNRYRFFAAAIVTFALIIPQFLFSQEEPPPGPPSIPFSDTTRGNGIVQGRVTDTLNVGIPEIIVEVLQALNTDPRSEGCFVYFGRTDSNGYYQISHIVPGVYKLLAVSPTPQYANQWYDGVLNPMDANKVTIADSPSVTIVNFTLRGGAERLPTVTVSGFVADMNLLPIKNAAVFFVRSGFALNEKTSIEDFREYFSMEDGKADFRLERRSRDVFITKVDSLGNYSLEIPQGSYIAFAKARGYETQFYLNQSDPLSANLLVLRNDSSGINFTLTSFPPVVFGSISGSVQDSSQHIGIPSRIIAFRDCWTPEDSHRFPSYFVDTDSLGVFTIDSLVPGSYFVFAVPLGNYAPAFYSTDTTSIRWNKATSVDINGNTINGINIYVHQIPSSARGFASIFGTVHFSRTTEGIAGAFVYANRSSSVVGYAITNQNGNFSIEGLAPGTYTITMDKPGYTEPASKSVGVSYSTTGNPVNANVDLSVDVITAVNETPTLQPVKFTLGQNFPNPFNPSTTINYTLNKSGLVTLKVYNLLGQEVRTLVNGFQSAGSYRATFNAQGLSSGVYFYSLHSQNSIQTKKMILLQ